MTAERLFAVIGGGVLIMVGLVFLVQIGVVIWLPGRVYEAAATFALYPNGPMDADGSLRNAWNVLPPDATVGLEAAPGQPHVYRLRFRSSDPAQATVQANAVMAAAQANAARTHAGRFEIIHPADTPMAWTSPRNRQLRSSAFVLLLALLPIYFGLRLLFRRPS